jgi:hypothetical protein
MRITIPFGLIVLALIAGYFLKPGLADHRKAAEAWLEQTRADAAANLNLGDLANAGAASVFSNGLYEDDLFFSRYTVAVGDQPYLRCFGIFTRISCSKVEHNATEDHGS